jgi:CTP synthase (UTP-ammonia lyase)
MPRSIRWIDELRTPANSLGQGSYNVMEFSMTGYQREESLKIGVIGDHNAGNPTHVATTDALRHAAASLNLSVDVEWVPTDSVGDSPQSLLKDFAGLFISPGSPYKSMSGALNAIRFAREGDLPLLGTCGGLQHMVIEFARNVLGFKDAAHAEYDPYASTLFVTPLSCSLVGREMSLEFAPGSRVAAAYGRGEAVESYYCNFGVNPEYQDRLHESDFRIVGTDANDEPRILEIPQLRFFIGSLFVPQVRSRPEEPHPLVLAFVEAARSA